MMYWCFECEKAVEPSYTDITDYHCEVDDRCEDARVIMCCPECGAQLYEDYPNSCALCKEPCSPEEELCEDCKGIIRERIATMASDLGVTVSMMTESLESYLAEV